MAEAKRGRVRTTGKNPAVSRDGASETSKIAMPNGAQAVGRALAVLRLLVKDTAGLSATRIAEELDLTPGTAHRLVRALLAEGYVAHDRILDRYYLGSSAIVLGQAAQRALGVDRARPLLEQLSAETSESVNLVIRDGNSSLIILRFLSPQPLRFEQHPGDRYPLYATASGKAILAFSDDAATYLSRLPNRLEPLTDNTLKTPAALARDLNDIRNRGYSIDNEEAFEGVRCVGAPVLDTNGRANAAVVVQAPVVRMKDARVTELGDRVIEVARQVAQVVPPEGLSRNR